MTILETYKNGNTMKQTADLLKIDIDRVRKVVLRGKAMRTKPGDRYLLENLSSRPEMTPNGNL